MDEEELKRLEDRWPRRMSDYRGNDVHRLIAEVRRLNGELAAANRLKEAVEGAFKPTVDFFEGKAMVPADKAWKVIFAMRGKDVPEGGDE